MADAIEVGAVFRERGARSIYVRVEGCSIDGWAWITYCDKRGERKPFGRMSCVRVERFAEPDQWYERSGRLADHVPGSRE